MPLVIHYLDKNNKIQERFIKLFITGEVFAEELVNCVTNEMSLDIKDCRSQCDDGADITKHRTSGTRQ